MTDPNVLKAIQDVSDRLDAVGMQVMKLALWLVALNILALVYLIIEALR